MEIERNSQKIQPRNYKITEHYSKIELSFELENKQDGVYKQEMNKIKAVQDAFPR